MRNSGRDKPCTTVINGSRDLKILYLHQHLAIREGATGTRSYEFARLLKERGHQVTMLGGSGELSGLNSTDKGLVNEIDFEGIRILQLNVPYSQKMSYLRRIFAFLWFMMLSSWVATRQRKVDVIFATSTPLTIAIPAMIASLINRRPYVFEVRDLWPEVPVGLGILRNPLLITVARWLERTAYRRATHIVACSPGMKDGIVKTGISPEKVTVISNACDIDLFDVPESAGINFRSRHSFLNGRPLVVYTGAFGLVNGLEYMVRLAKRVSAIDEKIAFLLVGTGREKAGLLSLAEQLGVLNKNFWLMDAVPRLEVPSVLSAATVATSTVVPNPVLWNNSANKFFDSLAAGRPIIINHEGWLADLLRETGVGIVLPADDIDQAAEMLTDFLSSEAKLSEARRAAKELARERFNRNRLVLQLESILQNASVK
jgi:glycosyltransferase involved in cell wall biosynthesis